MNHTQTGKVVGVAATVSIGLLAEGQGALEKFLGLVEMDPRANACAASALKVSAVAS